MLSAEVERFLESVASVSELLASDAALAEAAQALDGEPPAPCRDVQQKLRFITELRREIALAVARIRSNEALQVLGS